MPDITRRLKKARDELSRFQQQLHAKQIEREKLTREVEEAEADIRRIKSLKRELRLKKSLLGRLDLDINRLNAQKRRIEREAPNLEREFQKMESARRFGKKAV